jgi:hypothetical protein
VCVLIKYQVDLTGGPDEVCLSGLPKNVCVLIKYQADLTGGPDEVCLSDLPDGEWLA